MAPRPFAPLTAAHYGPRPFLADSPTSLSGPLGLDTAPRAGSISALFLGILL